MLRKVTTPFFLLLIPLSLSSKKQADFIEPSREIALAQSDMMLDDKKPLPSAVIGTIVALRQYCLMARDEASKMVAKGSTDSALPSFIVAFGKPAGPAPKAKPQYKDGIRLPGAYTPPPFNVVVEYAKAMGRAKKKFEKSGGINANILKGLDKAVVAGTPVLHSHKNEHKGDERRIALNPSVLGFTGDPTYLYKLDVDNNAWRTKLKEEAAKMLSADAMRAASLLKEGAKNTYKSFMSEAMLAEHSKLKRYHQKEIDAALKAIQATYAEKSGKDTFRNIQMLPMAGKGGADKIPAPKYKTAKEIQAEAEAAANKYANTAKTKVNAVDQIKHIEIEKEDSK